KLLDLRCKYLDNLKKMSELQEENYISNKHYEQLLYLSRRKSIAELSNGISHRINEHLTAIENVYENLKGDEGPSKEMDVLYRSCQVIESILNLLGEYITAALTEKLEPFSVKFILHRVLNHMEYKFQNSHVGHEITHEEELETVGNIAHFSDTLFAIIQN